MAFTFLSRSTLKGEKATLGTSFWSRFSPTGFARILLRFFQFVLGITVIGLYAGDVARARQAGAYVDSKWVWAVVCGALGAGAALVLMLPLVKAWFFFYVDAFLFLCYLVAFGIFGRIFIPVDVNEGKGKDNTGIRRMKHAVWVLLTNMLLWLVTAILGAVVFWKSRKRHVMLDVEVQSQHWDISVRKASTASLAHRPPIISSPPPQSPPRTRPTPTPRLPPPPPPPPPRPTPDMFTIAALPSIPTASSAPPSPHCFSSHLHARNSLDSPPSSYMASASASASATTSVSSPAKKSKKNKNNSNSNKNNNNNNNNNNNSPTTITAPSFPSSSPSSSPSSPSSPTNKPSATAVAVATASVEENKHPAPSCLPPPPPSCPCSHSFHHWLSLFPEHAVPMALREALF